MDEKVLIEKTLLGDKNAFEQIVNIYKAYIFAVILNFVKDHNEVENIAQEVFLQIYISLPQYKLDNFKGWIGKIAANKAIDWKRKKQSKFKEEVVEDTEEILSNQLVSDQHTPENLFIEKEKKEKIKKLLDAMPEIYKNVIIKFYFEDKSYEEIALEEDSSIRTIESRLYRGKNMLKEKWREEYDSLP